MRLYEPTHWIPVPATEGPGSPERTAASKAEGFGDKTADPVLFDVGR